MCQDTEGKAILRLLADATMGPHSRLKIIILSRPYRAIRELYGAYDILMEAENRADIIAVVEHGLQSLISTINSGESASGLPIDRRRFSRPPKSADPRFGEVFLMANRAHQSLELANIKHYLLSNAQGVMLWVALCINYAVRHAEKSIYTWSEIRKIIEGLPRELDDVYRTILLELPAATDAEELAKARGILSWIVVAGSYRPLRLKELVDIVALSNKWRSTDAATSETSPWQAQRPVFISWSGFARSIGYLCGPLVEFINVGERSTGGSDHGQDITASSVVQLLHQTVKDFLEESSDHIFRFMPGEARQSVERDSYSYIHRVLPLKPAPYCPNLDDVNDDWKESVNDTVHYLEDKFLLSFILSSRLIDLQPYIEATCDPDEEVWPFRKLFLEVKYWDTDLAETAKKSVVGRCFWLSCTLGMDMAVENLLYLSSLKPGWWMYHREVVLSGASVAAKDHRLQHLRMSLGTSHRDTLYVMLALTRYSFQDSSSRILKYEDRRRFSAQSDQARRRSSFHPDKPVPARRIESSPPPVNGATQQVVTSAICQILHYLECHRQPLDTVRAKRLGDLGECRCTSLLQDQEDFF